MAEETKPTVVEETEPKEIEEVQSDNEAVEDDHASHRAGKQTKNEKKARKAILKHGLVPVPKVMRVAMKRDQNTLFSVNQPDVYRTQDNSTYVIFGEIRVEDISQARKYAEEAAKNATAPHEEEKPAAEATEAAAEPAAEAAAENVDAGDLAEEEISFVMEQTKCDRSQAIKALHENNKDMVNAIMSLTNNQ